MASVVQVDPQERLAGLVGPAAEGESVAIAELVHHCTPDLIKFLRRRGASHAEALANLVLAEFVRNLPRLRFDSSRQVWAYLYRIARSRLVDEQRRAQRECQTQQIEQIEVSDGGQQGFDERVVDGVWIADLLEALTADQRQVLDLRFREDLTLEETARRTGKTLTAVKGLQRRALASLATAVSIAAAVVLVAVVLSLIDRGTTRVRSTEPVDGPAPTVAPEPTVGFGLDTEQVPFDVQVDLPELRSETPAVPDDAIGASDDTGATDGSPGGEVPVVSESTAPPPTTVAPAPIVATTASTSSTNVTAPAPPVVTAPTIATTPPTTRAPDGADGVDGVDGAVIGGRPPGTPIRAPGHLQSVDAPGMCLGFAGRSAAAGGPVELQRCRGAANQQFSFRQSFAGSYLHNERSGLCLRAVAGLASDWDHLVVDDCDRLIGSLWNLVEGKLQESASGRCLTLTGTTARSSLTMNGCGASPGQTFSHDGGDLG